MAEAGTVEEKALSKRREYVYLAIDLGSGRKDVVAVRGDVAEYFGMTADPTATQDAYRLVTKKTTVRSLYVDLKDIDPVASKGTTNNKFALPKQLTTSGGGKTIVIPTELKTAKGHVRRASIRFTSKANLAAISNFLYTKMTAKKPSWFITPSGVRRAIVQIPVGDINPGEEATTDAAT